MPARSWPESASAKAFKPYLISIYINVNDIYILDNNSMCLVYLMYCK